MFVVLYIHSEDEKDQGREEFHIYKDADSCAQDKAAEGYDVEILSRERTYAACYDEPRDMCQRYGLKPGIDFPISLRSNWA